PPPYRRNPHMVKAGTSSSGTRFPRAARLLQHAAFERVYAAGHRHFGNQMTFFYLLAPAGTGSARVGLTVGRALGGAVIRNRIKRRMRDVVRHEIAPLQQAMQDRSLAAEVVINPKKTALTAEHPALREQVRKGFSMIAGAEAG